MNCTEQQRCQNVSACSDIGHKNIKKCVSEEFSSDIIKYLSSSTAKTQESLGKVMGYSAKHISRLKNKQQFPTINALRTFYCEFFNQESINNLSAKFSKNSIIKQYMSSLDPFFNSKIKRDYNRELDLFLREDVDRSSIFMTITESKNLTISEITSLYPKNGIDVLNEMEEKEFIKIDENNIITPFKRNISFSGKTTRHLIKQFALNVSDKEVNAHQASNSMMYNRLNKKELQDILKIHKSAKNAIDNIISNSNNSGEHIVITGQFTTTIKQPKHKGDLQ